MRRAVAIACGIVWLAASLHAQTTQVNFENDQAGKPPAGFSFARTGQGKEGVWVVARDEQSRERGYILAQTDGDRTNSRFPVAVLDGMRAADVDLSVKFKPVSGRVDQAAGLVWRYQDANNYYIVRANALENNVVLYKVQNGRRTDLPLKGEGRTYGKDVPVPSVRWSELRVVAKGTTFTVFFNGEKLYDVDDATFPGAGRVGLWTKADSVTYFDDLVITASE